MIEAIYIWLSQEFPQYNWIKQSLKKTDPQDYILVIDTGGSVMQWPHPITNLNIQIITSAVTDERARNFALDVFNFIDERYDVSLSDGKSDYKFAKIRAIDRPFPLGNDGEGFQYSINYEFILLPGG
jgi:hypothetical protein